MKKSPPPSTAWYALRRTLSTWSFEKNLRELVKRLPEYRTDEVIVVVDTEDFTHGQPPLDWLRAYQKNLFRIAEAMTKIGVRYSLNPWITVGHCDRGRDDRGNLPGLTTMVGDNGVQCTSCACPLDPVWRAHAKEAWTIYGETRPAVIWVEDDIRTFNHEPIQFGCFCELHMARFSQAVGRPVAREEFIAALMQPGRPHEWRATWLGVQREAMNDTVHFLARTVHAVSPESCLGLMSSGPRQHVLDGRDWRAFGEAMGDGQPIYSRPPMDNYVEGPLRGFYYSHDSIKATRHCLPDAIDQTEVESIPFTRYAKSAAFTFLEMAVSFAYGCQGVTMNIYDHSGVPMADEPWYGEMFAAKKPFLNALAAAAQKPGRYRGVQLLHHDRSAEFKHAAAGARYGSLAEDGAATMEMLETHGLATTYDAEGVIATSGQTLRAFSDDQLRAMLAGGLLLDARAALVLFERGFGDQIGLAGIEPPRCVDDIDPLGAEEFFHEDFGGADKTFLTLTLPWLMCRPSLSILHPAARAIVVSRMVNPDAQGRYPGMTVFENSLGGRVAIHALELSTAFGTAFCHPHRRRQLHGVLTWLSRGPLPLAVDGGVYPLAFRKDCGDTSLLGLFNLTLDAWPSAEFTLAEKRRVVGMKVLKQDGRWAKSKALSSRKRAGSLVVSYDAPV
ncbi:MAG: hypothetical protein NT031_13860, partial [Planctomycetota bacterium]|nr:hypothetical protein [Planctomycetota bacterium]